jgi:hypothetical protein
MWLVHPRILYGEEGLLYGEEGPHACATSWSSDARRSKIMVHTDKLPGVLDLYAFAVLAAWLMTSSRVGSAR